MSTAEEIEEYYDKTTEVYLDIYGKVIQAFRPSSERKLLTYLADSIGMKKGQSLLDAGCGVGGPALWFARRKKVSVKGVTISGTQVDIAQKAIAKEGMEKRVEIRKGDYHHLSEYYPKASFDGALFLESLGHAADPQKVIREAASVLKDGAYIYIKDFFRKESSDPEFQKKVDVVIGRMDEHYCYNTLRLLPLLEALRSCDFEIDFIRRFDFKDDTSIRARFEEQLSIGIFDGYEEFWPAEWLEIRCTRHKG